MYDTPLGTMEGISYQTEKMSRVANIRERMDHAIKAAEEKLARTKEAKDILDKNPDLERLLNIMQQGVF